jgi:hypothetical protein
MAYLNCPDCGLSVALLFPCAPIEHCPRCLARRRKAVELFVSATPRKLAEVDNAIAEDRRSAASAA